jgi:hypothetical protein
VQHAVGGHIGALVGVGLGVGIGLAGYVAVQSALGAPELPPSLRIGSRLRTPLTGAPPGIDGAA